MRSPEGAAISAEEASTLHSPAWPATRQARAHASALLGTLSGRLLSSNSATSTLEHWCLGEATAGDAAIHARRIACADRPPSAKQRERLEVGRREQVMYRRVELAFGARVLCEAENWYVPSRLTPAIRDVLADSDTPFGRAVAALNPRRETFAVDVFWRPDDETVAPAQPGGELTIPWLLFQHRAIVYREARQPFSEVNETYTREILAFGPLMPDSR